MRQFPKIDNFFITDNKIYITDIEYNYIGVLDKNADFVELKCVIKYEEDRQYGLFGDVFIYEDSIFVIPLMASDMYKVNFEKEKIEALRIFDKGRVCADSMAIPKFMSAHIWNDSVILMPVAFPAIIEYDLKSGNEYYYDDWVETVMQTGRMEEEAFFRKTMVHSGVIYAPLCRSDKILKFFIDERRWEIITVDNNDFGYSDICFDGESFWLSPRKGNVVTRYNESSGEICYINGIWDEDTYIAEIKYWNNKIWIVPRTQGSVGIMDSDHIIRDLGICGSHFAMRIYQNILFISSGDDGVIYRFEDEKVTRCELKLKQDITDYYNYYFSQIYSYFNGSTKNNLFKENQINTLQNYIRGIVSIG